MGFLDAQLAALHGEPHPTTGEMSGSALGKLFLQTVRRPEGIIDHALQLVGSAGFVGCHRMPVETVVPALSRVVEEACIAATSGSNDVFQALVYQIAALDRRVGLVDIRLVMLTMMERQGLCRYGRLQRGVFVRQVDQLKSH